MRVFVLFCLIVFQFMLCAVEFKDSKFDINLTYDENEWQVAPNETFRNRLTLRHNSDLATFNVIAYRFNDTITANGLVQRRIQSVYDGWQLVHRKDVDRIDLVRKNLKEGITSMYRKSILNERLSETFLIVGDICYVAEGDLGIILNFSAGDKKTLFKMKNEFKSMIKSFWYGKNRSEIVYVNNDSNEWVMADQNLSRRRYHMGGAFLKDFEVKDRKIIDRTLGGESIKSLYNKNGVYLIKDRELSFYNYSSRKFQNLMINLVDPQLFLNKNGITIIQKRPKLVIKKYDLSFKLLNQHESNESFNNAFPVGDDFILINNSTIRLIHYSKTKWEINHNYNISHIVSNQDRLFLADQKSNRMVYLDLRNGQVRGQINNIYKLMGQDFYSGDFVDVMLNQSHLYALIKFDQYYGLVLINIDKGFKVEHQYVFNYNEVEIISLTTDYVVLKYKENNQDYLEALDLFTFASAWKTPFDNYKQMLTMKRHILAIDEDKNLISFDLNSGEQTLNSSFKFKLDQLFESGSDQKILKMFPYNNYLFTIISAEDRHNLVVFR